MQAEFESIMINRGDALVGLAHDGNTEMITRLVEIYGADVNHVHSKDVVSPALFSTAVRRVWCACICVHAWFHQHVRESVFEGTSVQVCVTGCYGCLCFPVYSLSATRPHCDLCGCGDGLDGDDVRAGPFGRKHSHGPPNRRELVDEGGAVGALGCAPVPPTPRTGRQLLERGAACALEFLQDIANLYVLRLSG